MGSYFDRGGIALSLSRQPVLIVLTVATVVLVLTMFEASKTAAAEPSDIPLVCSAEGTVGMARHRDDPPSLRTAWVSGSGNCSGKPASISLRWDVITNCDGTGAPPAGLWVPLQQGYGGGPGGTAAGALVVDGTTIPVSGQVTSNGPAEVGSVALVETVDNTSGSVAVIEVEPGTWQDCSGSMKIYWAATIPCTAVSGQLPTGVVIEDLGTAVELPPTGHGAGGATTNEIPGASDMLEVEHRADGTVSVRMCGPDVYQYVPEVPPLPSLPGGGSDSPGGTSEPPPSGSDPPPASADSDGLDPVEDSDRAAPKPCKDRAWNYANDDKADRFAWTSALQWTFKKSSTPGSLNAGTVENHLVDGTRAITEAHNNCGRGDNLSATHSYLGGDGGGAGIRPENGKNRCKGPNWGDGANQVDFGDLTSGSVAHACWMWREDPGRDTGIESDIRFNKDDFKFTTNPGSGCQNRYTIRSVMAHERGHSYGLGHVSEGKHGNLTMSEDAEICSDSHYTLGLGDLLGLEELY